MVTSHGYRTFEMSATGKGFECLLLAKVKCPLSTQSGRQTFKHAERGAFGS